VLRWPVRPDIDLRLPEERDADELLAVIEDNRERLEEWLHWAHSTHTREDVLKFVQMARRDFQKPDGLHLLIVHQGRIIGGSGFVVFNELSNYGEIGYWIATEFSGNGIVTDCCRALINYAFCEMQLNRVQIRCATANARSAAIARRLGFLHEGTLRQTIRTNNRLDDEHCFGLLRSEWAKAKAAAG
jgi:ribosomal-protein-serine acetyltransferase